MPSERPSSGSFRGPKMIERDHEDDDQLGHANGTNICLLLTGHKPRRGDSLAIIGTASPEGQGNPPWAVARSLCRRVGYLLRCPHATLPRRLHRGVRSVGLGAGRRPLRQPARSPSTRRCPSTTRPSLRRLARSSPSYVETHRVGPAGLRRDSRHAGDARSAFELLRSAGIRADARAAGRPLLRHRHPDSGDRRRHHGAARLRRLAGQPSRHAPRRRHRHDRRRDARRAGRPSRR